MSSGGPGNSRRTPSREKYERLEDAHEEREMQHVVSNIPPTNAAADGDVVVDVPVKIDTHDDNDVFTIPHKHVTPERLRRWRKATLSRNPSRRFRYTLKRDLARIHSETLEATKLVREKTLSGIENAPNEGYGIGPITLAKFVRDQDLNALEQNGGVNGVANLLHTDIEKGIREDPREFESRRKAYGENTYPRKAARNFWVFVWEAFQDTTLIVLMICAALSLALGIKTEVSFSCMYVRTFTRSRFTLFRNRMQYP